MEKEKNQGICLLRIILAYEVIMCHFFTAGGILAYYKTFAVPCFFVISFFYSADIIINRHSERVRKKIVRLLIPFWIWGVIYYVFLGLIMKKATLIDLLWQLITGSSNSINPPLWFLANQIAVTLIMYGIYKLSGNYKRGNIIVIIVMLLCVLLQYSGMNLRIFEGLPWELKWNMGRMAEVFPSAAVGILLYQLLHQFEMKHLYKVISCIVCVCVLGGLYCVNIPNGYGFGYEGLTKLIGAGAMVIFFYMLPIKKIDIVEKASSYTLGIYCLHWGLGNIVKESLCRLGLQIRESMLCIMIFVTALIVSVMICYLPIKGIKRIVS